MDIRCARQSSKFYNGTCYGVYLLVLVFPWFYWHTLSKRRETISDPIVFNLHWTIQDFNYILKMKFILFIYFFVDYYIWNEQIKNILVYISMLIAKKDYGIKKNYLNLNNTWINKKNKEKKYKNKFIIIWKLLTVKIVENKIYFDFFYRSFQWSWVVKEIWQTSEIMANRLEFISIFLLIYLKFLFFILLLFLLWAILFQ